MRSKLLVLFLALTFSTAAFSARVAHDGGAYGSVGLTHLKADGGGVDFQNQLVEGRIGFKFTPNFSVEGRAAFAITDDSIGAADVEIENYFGVYLRGEVPVGDKVNFYGYLGVTNVGVKASAFGISTADDDTDFSYGLGLRFRMNKDSSIGVEYMNLYDEDGVDITGFNIHFQRTF